MNQSAFPKLNQSSSFYGDGSKVFGEYVCGDEGEIANYCEVKAGEYFVSIITDNYEGHAHMHVSVARKLLEVLPRAIAHVEELQKKG